MIWLACLLIIVQSLFYWVLKPAINLGTLVFEFRFFVFFVVLVLAWIFAANDFAD